MRNIKYQLERTKILFEKNFYAMHVQNTTGTPACHAIDNLKV